MVKTETKQNNLKLDKMTGYTWQDVYIWSFFCAKESTFVKIV